MQSLPLSVLRAGDKQSVNYRLQPGYRNLFACASVISFGKETRVRLLSKYVPPLRGTAFGPSAPPPGSE